MKKQKFRSANISGSEKALSRQELELREERMLAPYAMKARDSRGRLHEEEEHPYRSAYQRDRDRIIHSAAFRRLEYKTQVFVYHEGDYYRTRLTHTLEVTQIARTISKILGLNEDLTEAVSLAHDVGHTPFGHAVEATLNGLMARDGGFDHNTQGLRVVDILEERYPSFKGLNLSWETREGIIKHSTTRVHRYPKEFLKRGHKQPLLETQVMDVADEIAYDSHDLDDGIKSGMLTEDDLRSVALWNKACAQIKNEYSNISRELRVYLAIRNLINLQVGNLIDTTIANIRKFDIRSVSDVIQCAHRMVTFGKELRDLRAELRSFLYKRLYCHWRVVRMSDKAKRFVTELFSVYLNNPELLPPGASRGKNIKRNICDHIAGMTDRYALQEYKRLFDPYEKV
ncbi:MAG: deoxyguanosinetriphosphate triphosphohydrolase [Candidatus Omnitrophota bacterium]|nr:deoxyguanosinetriphosphate triphosphohydrolase [Candidatus Omnitrophota bacterium]